MERSKAAQRLPAREGAEGAGDGRPAAAGDLLFLLYAATPAEYREIAGWIDRSRPGREQRLDAVSASQPSRLASRLHEAADDLVVVPLGVVWLGRESSEGDSASRPQRWAWHDAARRGPSQGCHVLMGEPARAGDLRRRWLGGAWIDAGPEAFARFVLFQGALALERAERALVGSRHKVPSQVAADIARSHAFWAEADRLSRGGGRRVSEVAQEALGYLDEMMARQTRVGLDLFARLHGWLLRSYRIEFRAPGLESLRRLNRRHSLVFLPNHWSYLDPMALGTGLRQRGFPPNHVLGGANLAFWPMGALARRAGVVFIRRSFRDNPVYRFALCRYLGYLLEKRFNLEWYLEGGRSRTGKLRPPRFGLFAYLIEAYQQGSTDDVALVPVSIVYDQLYEVSEMTREALGEAKPRESLGQLLGYARAQSRRFGAIHVRVGEALLLSQALAAAGDPRHAVPKVALEVAHRINQLTPITPTSLVTLVLLGSGDRGLSLADLQRGLDPLLAYVKRRGLPLTEEGLLDDQAGIKRTLAELSRHRVVEVSSEGGQVVYAIGRDQHLVAAFYRNSAIHHFVERAIGELAVAHLAEGDSADPMAKAWAEALRLRDLFKFEFFFPRRSEFADRLRLELEMLDPEERALDLRSALARARLHLADRVLGSFVEAYSIVAGQLALHEPGRSLDEKAFLRDCLGAGRHDRLYRPDAVSAELFRSALQLIGNRGLAGPGGDELAHRRRQFAGELDELRGRLERIRRLAVRDLQPASERR